jgi:hypothetical protein
MHQPRWRHAHIALTACSDTAHSCTSSLTFFAAFRHVAARLRTAHHISALLHRSRHTHSLHLAAHAYCTVSEHRGRALSCQAAHTSCSVLASREEISLSADIQAFLSLSAGVTLALPTHRAFSAHTQHISCMHALHCISAISHPQRARSSSAADTSAAIYALLQQSFMQRCRPQACFRRHLQVQLPALTPSQRPLQQLTLRANGSHLTCQQKQHCRQQREQSSIARQRLFSGSRSPCSGMRTPRERSLAASVAPCLHTPTRSTHAVHARPART